MDEPVHPYQEEIDEAIKLFPVERIPERNGDHIIDVPVPQTSEEVAEVVKALTIVPQECISGRICGQIDDDPVPVDPPGDQACRDPQACESPLTQFIDKVVAVPIAIHRQVLLLLNQLTKHIKTPTSIHRKLTWLLTKSSRC